MTSARVSVSLFLGRKKGGQEPREIMEESDFRKVKSRGSRIGRDWLTRSRILPLVFAVLVMRLRPSRHSRSPPSSPCFILVLQFRILGEHSRVSTLRHPNDRLRRVDSNEQDASGRMRADIARREVCIVVWDTPGQDTRYISMIPVSSRGPFVDSALSRPLYAANDVIIRLEISGQNGPRDTMPEHPLSSLIFCS